jgi:hypothetical protein
MKTNLFAMPVLLMALLGISAGAAAQPSTMPEGATQVLPEMGVEPKKPEANVPPDMKPRKRLQLKPRMKSDELSPAFHPELKPEMSPGLQPNSQKPLRKDNLPRSGG